MLNATVDVGAADAAPTVTVDMGLYDRTSGGYVANDAGLYFHGVVSSPDVRVDVYATPRGGKPILIGQATPWSDISWNLQSDVPLADGLYTIQARAVDVSTGLAGALTPMAAKLNVDNVGPRVVGVRFVPRQGQVVVTLRDFGGDGNAGVGLDLNTVNYPSYALAPPTSTEPHGTPDAQWQVTEIVASPASRRGPQRVVVTFNDGAPIPTGSYGFFMQSPGPQFPAAAGPPYFVHIPYYALGIRDQAGNPLDGNATSTITPDDSNDFATELTSLGGRGFQVKPRPVAPSRPHLASWAGAMRS